MDRVWCVGVHAGSMRQPVFCFPQQDFLDQVLQELLKTVFAVSWDAKTLFSTHRPIFCHFGNPAYAAKDGPYALVAAFLLPVFFVYGCVSQNAPPRLRRAMAGAQNGVN